jgi:hypothetical protein
MDEASGTRFDSHGSLDLTESGGAVASRNVIGGDGIDISQAGTEILVASPGTTPAFSQNTLTVAAWTTIDALASFNTIFSYGTNLAAPPWTTVALTMGYRSSPGAFEVFFGHGGTFAQIQGTTFGAVSPSTLYLVAAYLDTTNNLMGISVDGGAWQTAANANGAFNAGAAYDITVGRYKTVAPFRLDGGAARIGMWNRILSNADLITLYNSGAGLTYAQL